MKNTQRVCNARVGVLLVLAGLAVSRSALAFNVEIPNNLNPLILSEAVPSAFAPADFSAADFKPVWKGAAIPGISLELERDSLQWVRVKDYFVFPRGRLRIRAKKDALESGVVSSGGYSQGFVTTAEMPVVLDASSENEIEIRIRPKSDRSHEIRGVVQIQFKPSRPENRGLVLYDASCSRYGVERKSGQIDADTWLLLSCRMVYARGDDSKTSSLEVYASWSGNSPLSLDGNSIEKISTSLWALRLRSQPGEFRLNGIGTDVVISYRIPEEQHFGYLGLGVGVYGYTLREATHTNTYIPLITLYGSYLFTETSRLIIFDAAAVHTHFYNDFGGYISLEQARILDRRLAVNLLLGGHIINFEYDGEFQSKIGVPQGFELVYKDILGRGWDLGAGAFIYPPINDVSYYNAWVRLGKGGLFGELNYISWTEKVRSNIVFSQSVGVSLGFPLLQLF